MITGYPAGSELLLLNTIWHRPVRNADSGKYTDPAITLIYKDLITGEKGNQFINNPDYELYSAKEEVPIDHNMLYIEKEKVDKIKVPFKDILKEIAKMSGNVDFFYDNIKSGNRYENNKLMTYNRIFNADMNIEDHYRFRFDKLYNQNNIPNPYIGYFDIEADIIDMAGDFPAPGECPINAITIVDDKTDIIYTLLLRNEENPLIKDLEDKLSNTFGRNSFKNQINKKIEESCGNYKNMHRLGLSKFDYKIKFYDDEIELIHNTFMIINELKFDLVLAWNMAFDIPYIIQRIINLGYEPKDIMTHPDFIKKEAYYYIDERAKVAEERGDYASISSYSVFLDQLIQYASRRKGRTKETSYKLDHIGYVWAKMKKLDYSHITRNIALLPYKDYEVFTIYNIIDTIVQKAIETTTGDIEYIYNKSTINNTRYCKSHRQTVYLTNRATKEFSKNNYIIGNNTNKFKPRPEGKFPGAAVGNPMLLDQDSLLTVNGITIRLARNAVDFDYASLYPIIMKENNIAPNTEIGKINIIDDPYPDYNHFNNERFYDKAGYFIEDYMSGNKIEFARRWFKMPDIIEMKKLIIEYFDNNGMEDLHSYYDSRTGLFRPFVISDKGYEPFYIQEKDELICPFVTYYKREDIQ